MVAGVKKAVKSAGILPITIKFDSPKLTHAKVGIVDTGVTADLNLTPGGGREMLGNLDYPMIVGVNTNRDKITFGLLGLLLNRNNTTGMIKLDDTITLRVGYLMDIDLAAGLERRNVGRKIIIHNIVAQDHGN